MQVAGGVLAAGSAVASGSHALAAESTLDTKIPPEDYKATAKNVKQSVMAWCFGDLPKEKLIAACANMGMVAMEGIDKQYYPLMKQHGLGVAITSSHGFKDGPFDPANRESCKQKLIDGIDTAAEWDCPNVIAFTGMRTPGISDAQGEKNCIELWKDVCQYAEQKNVNVALEHLNSRDDSHPMKGHPGYFGDDVDHCVDMIRKVDSPRMKLLFDIYHVQIMNGDVIRRFRQYKDYVAHVHTAGNPGRCEIDENQELNYSAIIRAIVDCGYEGFVAQEFIPTWEDKLGALRHAVRLCDV
ncbi:MAG: TIM barrel protein [Planctomycetales bacterium]|nr:TIM barrel protein [Planctomycetales bacterium]